MVDKSIIQEWLQKGQSDFQFAEASLKEGRFYEQICYLFQQSAEKYLKAFIIINDLPFKKVHDLGVLIETLTEKFSVDKELKEACDFLTTFYVEARYPGFPDLVITKEIALRARLSAELIARFVTEQI